ncbi:neural cell adhesion molecule L1-like protein isoform X1, partial [Lates japonicus]
MRLAGSLQLALLLALTSRVSGLNIPLEVEQPPTIITQTSGPIIALPFDNVVTIRCEAKGNPPPEYRWTKDGQDFIPPHITTNNRDHTGGTFVLHSKNLIQFQGKYRCYASNKLGTAITEEIELSVPSVPKFPKEEINPLVVKEGEPVVLKCNPPAGVPPRQIYWMSIGLQHIEQDERVSMGIDGNLYFSNALQKDSRPDYCCYAAFSRIRTIVQKTAMAVVVKSLKPDNESANSSDASPPVRIPGLLLPSGVQTEKVLLKGEELQLECIPQGFPTPTVRWMKLGDKLPPRTKFQSFGKLLTISAVEESDQGKYKCIAENSAGEVDHYFDVIVEEPPKWRTEPPQSQLTVTGSDVHIKCSVGGKPPPDITWRRNGEFLRDEPEGNMRVFDDTVVLHNARPEDSAVYQCEASNSHGSVLANVNIMIMNMPPLILTRDYQEYAVILGGDIVMNCSVFGSPPPNISWAKNDTLKPTEGDRFFPFHNGSLQIISAEKDDSGNYMCAASNTEGKSTVTAVLDVKDPTKIVNPPQDMQIVSGTTAQLMCQAEHDKSLKSTFEVVWRKDGEEIPLSSKENSSVQKFRYFVDDGMLQIMSVNLSDQGIYTCIAKTSLDEDNATALLTVLDVPDAPRNLHISEIKSPRNISLSWIPGSDHNSSITEYIVEYEENKWDPGRWKELQKVPGNQATAELALYGHLNYQFRVYAVNAVGPGPPNVRQSLSFPGKRNHAIVPGLEPFSKYTLTVSVFNKKGNGPRSDMVTFNTPEGVPGQVHMLSASNAQEDSILLGWAPPREANGILTGYLLQYHLINETSLEVVDSQEMNISGADTTQWRLQGLEGGRLYQFRLCACTRAGCGPPRAQEANTITTEHLSLTPAVVPVQSIPALLNISSYVSDTFAKISWTAREEQQDSQLYVAYMNNRDGNWRISEAVNTSQSFHVIDGLKPGTVYTVRLMAKRLLDNASIFEEVIQTQVKAATGQQTDFSTQGWFIGTMCAVALLTLVALMACFVRRNKGGKYAGTPPPRQRPDMFSMEKVKEKEDLHPDVESQGMNDDTFCEY